MEVLMEKKMTNVIDEPVVKMEPICHDGKPRAESPPTELEPCEEFPILYGLLTAPKSFKPKNSEELQLLPQELDHEEGDNCNDNGNGLGLVITSRVQVVECRGGGLPVVGSREQDMMEEADSQNLDFCRDDRSRSSSRSTASSPHTVDSSSNFSSPDENDSPIFMNYLNGANIRDRRSRSSASSRGGDYSEDDTASLVSSLEGSSAGGDDCLDDNIPTSTTSGFRRKASRLETAIGNIVRRRRGQKRSNSNSCIVPISMAPSSPTVSTTCVDPLPPPQSSQNSNSRGRSEILERILRSTTSNTVNPATSQRRQSQHNEGSRNGHHHHDNNNNNNESNNNNNGYEPYAKLRDLLTMPEDQLVKRRRLEYGHGGQDVRRRECSPPRNNILASLLQKGRPYEPPSGGRYPSFENNLRNPSSLLSVNTNRNVKLSDNSSSNNNEERPYKCSLCDLRFKKLPLLNRHVKTHSHIKRYVCRFCTHAFKRSDNLLAHMRTSCKGIKEADAKFAAGGTRSNSNNRQHQIIPALLSPASSSPAVLAGPVSPAVSRSQLEEALLMNLRGQAEKIYSSPLVSTTTASPPLPAQRGVIRRQITQPVNPDFQSRHSKLLEILSGSPVIPCSVGVVDDHASDNDAEEMPLPLSLKVERSSSPLPSSSLSPSSSSSSQSQFIRSHQRLYSNLVKQNELLVEQGRDDLEEEDGGNVEEDEFDNEQPLNLGSRRASVVVAPAAPVVPSVRSRDHPEIVSILSRQPKNVVMMAPDLRKLVGID